MKKKIFSKISLACAFIASMLCYTSCLEDSETPSVGIDFANVGTTASGNWEFNLDGGATVSWSGSSNDSILKKAKRVYVYYTYYDSNVQVVNGAKHIKPEDCQVAISSIDSIYSKERLTAMKQLEEDSLFTYEGLNYSVARGYINIVTESQYADSKCPTAHLFYAPEEVTADTLAVRLVVNRHSKASFSGYVHLYYSFDLEPFESMYSSKDSIVVAVHNGVTTNPLCCKVSTKLLKKD